MLEHQHELFLLPIDSTSDSSPKLLIINYDSVLFRKSVDLGEAPDN